jgi:16S rRNA processing protein RimM
MNSFIECGKIINTHGCHGGLKLESWCNTPEDLAALKHLYLKKGDEYIAYSVAKASVFKQFVVTVWKTIDTMDLALSLKGKTVYAKRSDFCLEEGEYFLADLIGIPVIDARSGEKYGTVLEVINRGASDIYVVQTSNGERMIPAVDQFVDRIDVREGLFVTPIEGMLD